MFYDYVWNSSGDEELVAYRFAPEIGCNSLDLY